MTEVFKVSLRNSGKGIRKEQVPRIGFLRKKKKKIEVHQIEGKYKKKF